MSSKIFVKIHAVLRKLHMVKHMTTLTMCPIPQGALSLSSVLTMIPICPHFPLPIYQKRCQVVKKMSNVKKSNTWAMEEVHKKINWHKWGSHILMSILTSHMMVTKNPQNVHRKCFWTILVTFIFDVKIDINMCEPHCVNLFFLWTSSIVCVFNFFDIWHLFDILTSFNLNHLSPSQGYFYQSTPQETYYGQQKEFLFFLLLY